MKTSNDKYGHDCALLLLFFFIQKKLPWTISATVEVWQLPDRDWMELGRNDPHLL